MNQFRKFIKHNTGILSYLFFGVLTTLINMVVYAVLFQNCILNNVASTISAWIAATIFAFVTNKLFVFKSTKKDVKTLLYELGSFYFFRIATGIADILIMWVSVDILHLNPTLFKLISNLIVIVLNYLASKLVIFKKKRLFKKSAHNPGNG